MSLEIISSTDGTDKKCEAKPQIMINPSDIMEFKTHQTIMSPENRANLISNLNIIPNIYQNIMESIRYSVGAVERCGHLSNETVTLEIGNINFRGLLEPLNFIFQYYTSITLKLNQGVQEFGLLFHNNNSHHWDDNGRWHADISQKTMAYVHEFDPEDFMYGTPFKDEYLTRTLLSMVPFLGKHSLQIKQETNKLVDIIKRIGFQNGLNVKYKANKTFECSGERFLIPDMTCLGEKNQKTIFEFVPGNFSFSREGYSFEIASMKVKLYYGEDAKLSVKSETIEPTNITAKSLGNINPDIGEFTKNLRDIIYETFTP